MTHRNTSADRPTRMLAVSIAILAAILIAVPLASGAAGSPRTLNLVLPGTASRYVDVGPKGNSPGDYFLATGQVTNKVGGRRIGGLAGVWTLVSPAADDASFVLHLAQGTLYISGQIHHTAKTSLLRVAAGTGAFSGLHGTAVFRYLTDTSAALRITL
jgi:hypothetical protein